MGIERNLVFYKAGLLDPSETLEMEDALRASPELRQRLESLAERWSPSPAVSVPAWRIPPPGLSFGAHAGLPPVFSESRLRPGDRFEIHIDPLPEPEKRRVVVLRRDQPGWEVMYPTAEPQQTTLADLVKQANGLYRLDLAARRPSGRQRWAVALPWLDTPIDWSAPAPDRWTRLQQAIATGQVPVASVEVDISEA